MMKSWRGPSRPSFFMPIERYTYWNVLQSFNDPAEVLTYTGENYQEVVEFLKETVFKNISRLPDRTIRLLTIDGSSGLTVRKGDSLIRRMGIFHGVLTDEELKKKYVLCEKNSLQSRRM